MHCVLGVRVKELKCKQCFSKLSLRFIESDNAVLETKPAYGAFHTGYK